MRVASDCSAVPREADIYRALTHLSLPVVIPRLLGADDDGPEGPHRLWLEDVAATMQTKWTLAAADTAVDAAAALHLLVLDASDSSMSVLDETIDDFAAYVDHVPAARDDLAALQSHPDPVLTPELAQVMGTCLDRGEDFLQALSQQPRALQHGDFHPGNAGFDADGRLVLFDWAQAGRGLLGGDIAVFLSGYQAFGGDREQLSRAQFDERVWTRYAQVLLSGGAGEDVVQQVRRTMLWWACTWGVHARLGPGLGAVLSGVIPPEVLPAVRVDISDGCQRAAQALEELDG